MDFSGVKLKAMCYEQNSKDNDKVSAAINEKMGFEIEWIICPASEGWAAQDRPLQPIQVLISSFRDCALISVFI